MPAFRMTKAAILIDGGAFCIERPRGGVVGFDIDHASRRLDPSTLETEALPVRSMKAG